MSKQPLQAGKRSSPGAKTREEGRNQRPAPGAGIGHDQILDKYWELANLDPEVTKGSITGQLKALDSLREILGPAQGDRNGNPAKSTRSPDVYRSAWMANDESDDGGEPSGNEMSRGADYSR